MRATVSFLLVLFWAAPSFAFRFSPMVSTLSTSGPEATQTFQVENNDKEKIALQVEVFHRDMDVNGKETRKETEEFSVFPQQIVLEPGEKRSIRLTWTGSRQLKEELPYRLVVSQLPVDLKKPDQRKSGANITFLLQYVASVYVSPGASASKISVESIKKLSDGKVELVLKNSGTAHRVLKGLSLKGIKFKELESENILPGHLRRFEVALAQGAAAEALSVGQKAEVEFEAQ